MEFSKNHCSCVVVMQIHLLSWAEVAEAWFCRDQEFRAQKVTGRRSGYVRGICDRGKWHEHVLFSIKFSGFATAHSLTIRRPNRTAGRYTKLHFFRISVPASRVTMCDWGPRIGDPEDLRSSDSKFLPSRSEVPNGVSVPTETRTGRIHGAFGGSTSSSEYDWLSSSSIPTM
jgi:hypothetical protein